MIIYKLLNYYFSDFVVVAFIDSKNAWKMIV